MVFIFKASEQPGLQNFVRRKNYWFNEKELFIYKQIAEYLLVQV